MSSNPFHPENDDEHVSAEKHASPPVAASSSLASSLKSSLAGLLGKSSTTTTTTSPSDANHANIANVISPSSKTTTASNGNPFDSSSRSVSPTPGSSSTNGASHAGELTTAGSSSNVLEIEVPLLPSRLAAIERELVADETSESSNGENNADFHTLLSVLKSPQPKAQPSPSASPLGASPKAALPSPKSPARRSSHSSQGGGGGDHHDESSLHDEGVESSGALFGKKSAAAGDSAGKGAGSPGASTAAAVTDNDTAVIQSVLAHLNALRIRATPFNVEEEKSLSADLNEETFDRETKTRAEAMSAAAGGLDEKSDPTRKRIREKEIAHYLTATPLLYASSVPISNGGIIYAASKAKDKSKRNSAAAVNAIEQFALKDEAKIVFEQAIQALYLHFTLDDFFHEQVKGAERDEALKRIQKQKQMREAHRQAKQKRNSLSLQGKEGAGEDNNGVGDDDDAEDEEIDEELPTVLASKSFNAAEDNPLSPIDRAKNKELRSLLLTLESAFDRSERDTSRLSQPFSKSMEENLQYARALFRSHQLHLDNHAIYTSDAFPTVNHFHWFYQNENAYLNFQLNRMSEAIHYESAHTRSEEAQFKAKRKAEEDEYHKKYTSSQKKSSGSAATPAKSAAPKKKKSSSFFSCCSGGGEEDEVDVSSRPVAQPVESNTASVLSLPPTMPFDDSAINKWDANSTSSPLYHSTITNFHMSFNLLFEVLLQYEHSMDVEFETEEMQEKRADRKKKGLDTLELDTVNYEKSPPSEKSSQDKAKKSSEQKEQDELLQAKARQDNAEDASAGQEEEEDVFLPYLVPLYANRSWNHFHLRSLSAQSLKILSVFSEIFRIGLGHAMKVSLETYRNNLNFNQRDFYHTVGKQLSIQMSLFRVHQALLSTGKGATKENSSRDSGRNSQKLRPSQIRMRLPSNAVAPGGSLFLASDRASNGGPESPYASAAASPSSSPVAPVSPSPASPVHASIPLTNDEITSLKLTVKQLWEWMALSFQRFQFVFARTWDQEVRDILLGDEEEEDEAEAAAGGEKRDAKAKRKEGDENEEKEESVKKDQLLEGGGGNIPDAETLEGLREGLKLFVALVHAMNELNIPLSITIGSNIDDDEARMALMAPATAASSSSSSAAVANPFAAAPSSSSPSSSSSLQFTPLELLRRLVENSINSHYESLLDACNAASKTAAASAAAVAGSNEKDPALHLIFSEPDGRIKNAKQLMLIVQRLKSELKLECNRGKLFRDWVKNEEINNGAAGGIKINSSSDKDLSATPRKGSASSPAGSALTLRLAGESQGLSPSEIFSLPSSHQDGFDLMLICATLYLSSLWSDAHAYFIHMRDKHAEMKRQYAQSHKSRVGKVLAELEGNVDAILALHPALKEFHAQASAAIAPITAPLKVSSWFAPFITIWIERFEQSWGLAVATGGIAVANKMSALLSHEDFHPVLSMEDEEPTSSELSFSDSTRFSSALFDLFVELRLFAHMIQSMPMEQSQIEVCAHVIQEILCSYIKGIHLQLVHVLEKESKRKQLFGVTVLNNNGASTMRVSLDTTIFTRVNDLFLVRSQLMLLLSELKLKSTWKNLLPPFQAGEAKMLFSSPAKLGNLPASPGGVALLSASPNAKNPFDATPASKSAVNPFDAHHDDVEEETTTAKSKKNSLTVPGAKVLSPDNSIAVTPKKPGSATPEKSRSTHHSDEDDKDLDDADGDDDDDEASGVIPASTAALLNCDKFFALQPQLLEDVINRLVCGIGVFIESHIHVLLWKTDSDDASGSNENGGGGEMEEWSGRQTREEIQPLFSYISQIVDYIRVFLYDPPYIKLLHALLTDVVLVLERELVHPRKALYKNRLRTEQVHRVIQIHYIVLDYFERDLNLPQEYLAALKEKHLIRLEALETLLTGGSETLVAEFEKINKEDDEKLYKKTFAERESYRLVTPPYLSRRQLCGVIKFREEMEGDQSQKAFLKLHKQGLFAANYYQ